MKAEDNPTTPETNPTTPETDQSQEPARARVAAMIAEIHADNLRVLLQDVHDPQVQAKVTEAYWRAEAYESRK